MTDEAYAERQRTACAPLECNESPLYWVRLGGRDALSVAATKTPRCGACGGAVRFNEWRPPPVLAVPKEVPPAKRQKRGWQRPVGGGPVSASGSAS